MLERYRPTMSEDVLHSWAKDAQSLIDIYRGREVDTEIGNHLQVLIEAIERGDQVFPQEFIDAVMGVRKYE